MPFLLAASIGLLIWALVLARRLSRVFRTRAPQVPPVLQRLCDVVAVCVRAAFGLVSLGFALPAVAPRARFTGLLIGVLLVIADWSLRALRKWAIAGRKPRTTLRGLVKDLATAWMSTTIQFFTTVWKAIGPDDKAWKELWIPTTLVDRVLSIRAFVFVYLGGAVLVITLMIPSMLVTFGYMPGASGAVMRAAIGFNALFIVAVFTLITLVTASLAALLRSLGVVRFPIDLKRQLSRLAMLVGYGTLAGVISAALTPIATALFRQSASPPLSPSVLIDLPSAGAVGGYVIGLVVLATSLGRQSSNLVYQHLLFPAIFLGLLYIAYKLELTPEMLFQHVVTNAIDPAGISNTLCSASDNDDQVRAHLSDPAWLLAVANRCGGAVVIGGRSLVGSVAVGMSVVAGVRFLSGIRKGMKRTQRSPSAGSFAETDSDPAAKFAD